MRKALVLALVLVFAIAGASMAATPSFSGEVKLEAKSEGSFAGPFALVPSFQLDTNIAEEGENWTFDARVRTKLDTWTEVQIKTDANGDPVLDVNGNPVVEEVKKTGLQASLNRYKGVFNGDGFTATIARGYGLGNVDTPFTYVRLASNPGDRIRVTSDFAGVDVAAQVQGDNYLYLRAQTDAGLATVGTGMQIDLSPAKDSVYTGYLTTSVDIVNLRAIVGSFNGTTEYAVGAEVDLTEQLNIDVTYNTKDDKGFGVDATFTEGVLQAKAGYGQKDSEITASFIYRGSDDNQGFDVLFNEDEDDWNDEWHTNVAPAFGVFYSDDSTSDAKIEVGVVFPAADNFVARASFVTQASASSYSVEGWLGLSDKLTLNPEFSKDTANVNTIRAKAIYAVGENAEISVEGKRVGNNDSLVAAYSISF